MLQDPRMINQRGLPDDQSAKLADFDERNSLVFKYMQGARKVTKNIPSKKYYFPVRYILTTFRFPEPRKRIEKAAFHYICKNFLRERL